MQNILTLSLRQDSFLKSKKHDKINNSVKHGRIELISHDNCESTMPSLEEISVAKAKELLQKMLLPAKEDTEIFKQRSTPVLPANITEVPKFHEVKSKPAHLSVSAKETFARIGERARAKSLDEQIEEARAHFKQTFAKEQGRRARKYNIPFDASSVDYHQLSRKIDRYEFLLDEAKRWDISWDINIYDPVALEQELEEARSRYWEETEALRSGYFFSRRVEI